MNLAKVRKTDNEKLIKNQPHLARDNKPKAHSQNVITLANMLMQRFKKFNNKNNNFIGTLN